MKKIYILISLAVCSLATKAQLTLTGTKYFQNFDTIANGLPTGWACYYGATSSSLGTLFAFSGTASFGAYFDTTDCASDVYGHGFKNSASADGGYMDSNMTCAQQEALTNRALAVRQASNTSYPGYDPGVSFALELANTNNMGSFNLAFKLQGLDILCPRTTTWTVDYGIGAAPTTFTPVTAIYPIGGALKTGNRQFTNDSVVVTFGSALDNQTGPVWIRISTLAATTGSGNRTTSAIDDYTLVYTNTTGIATLSSQTIGFKTIGIANAGNANFACTVAKAGAYTLNIFDITGRQICAKQVTLSPGAQNNITITNSNLVAGMYIARITDGTATGIAKVIVQ